jgi:solute carrier family 25 phosphate transporter 23/24/25/41
VWCDGCRVVQPITRVLGRLDAFPLPPGCGMASSTAAMLCTYPLNLVRTRLQASGMPGVPSYAGPVECFARILKEEGASGLYRGVVPNLAKVLPATSISYAVYDLLSAWQQRQGD